MDNRVISPTEWQDSFLENEHRQLYTREQTKIPGLRLFAHQKSSSATNPLTLHYHKDCIEIVFVIKGNVNFTIKGKDYSLFGGDVFIAPPNVPHDTGNHPLGICEFYWMQIEMNIMNAFYLDPVWQKQLFKELENVHEYTIRNMMITKKTLSGILKLLISKQKNDKFQGVAQLIDLLYMLIHESKKTNSNLTQDIVQSLDWIFNHLHDNIMLEDLAKAVGLSLSQFKRKFNNQIGISPRKYITIRKIEYAKELLASGISVTDAAYQIGFNSSNYFSTVFRKITMMTPIEYRQSLKK
ncbi:AraC family transcriptional regulator [Clostridia bacterium]|nr:AraC family transcriptional regulator [Clostridia bacterium]